MKSWFCNQANDTDFLDSVNGSLLAASYEEDEDIARFLAGLALLEDVPIQNYLPNESLLPPESLRVFFVDQNWIDCLLDGALSIGRATRADAKHDACVFAPLSETAHVHASMVRRRLHGLPADLNAAEPPMTARSGFLLHSQVIAGYPGISIRCLLNGVETPILALRRVSEAILLCLTGGLIDEVEFIEPEESMHFGLFPDHDGKPYINLVPLNVLSGDSVGELKAPMRPNGRGVLDVRQLAAQMQKTLSEKRADIGHLSSVEFATEMMRRQVRHRMKID